MVRKQGINIILIIWYGGIIHSERQVIVEMTNGAAVIFDDLDELDAIIERNGGHIIPSNPGILTMDMSGDDLKFSNSDMSLDEVIERNGGHMAISNADTLFDASW